jgi:hypothetical protein
VTHPALLLTLLAVPPAALAVQTAPSEVDAAEALQAVDTSLGARYRAGGVHRFLFGTRYRALWTRPIRIPALDLRRPATALRPLPPADGQPAGTLRLVDANGRQYLLRPADPDRGAELRPDLRGTLLERLFQDQLSAVHPFGPLVADRMSGAVGLPRLHPRLVVVSGDSAAPGFVGYLEELPSPGFAGLLEVIDTETLLRARRERLDAVDARRYLAARMLDLLIGDWDRRRGQWVWGRSDSGGSWQPIPRGHGRGFSENDGVLPALARGGAAPYLVRFGTGRLPVAGLVWYSRDLDRELLTGLGWAEWEAAVTEVRSRLTDAAIDSATAEMPPEVDADARHSLAARLRARRQRLPDAARRFYLDLAAEADLHGTDAAERITVTGTPDGAVRVDLAGGGDPVSRQFEPSETGEVRIFAHGGADTLLARGERGRVRVRIVGGDGDDVLRRHDGPAVLLHQDGADWRPVPRAGDPPFPPDWGGRTTFLPVLGANSNAGVVLGLTLTHTDYGFRKLPFASRTAVKAAFGTTSARPGLALATVIQTGAPALDVVVTGMATGVDVLRFYLPGNESVEADDRDFHEVRNWQLELAPALEVTAAPGLVLGAGPRVRYVDSEAGADRLVGIVQPYGSGGFGMIGARAYARWDLRDLPTNPRRGLFLEAGGELVPAAWDVERSFQSAYAAMTAYVSAPSGWSPTLYLRGGARRVWGRYPYFEAARVGGSSSLRGYSTGRFLGDAAVFAQTELRVPVTRLALVVPGTLGVFGLADAGRVYLDGETSDKWHAGFGGGVWFAWLGGAKVASLAVARGSERTTLSVRVGAAF